MMKNTTRLILILSFILTLGMFAGLMFYTLSQFDSLRIKSEDIVEKNNTKVDLISNMHTAARERILRMSMMANTDDAFILDEIIQEFDSKGVVFSKARQTFQELELTPQEEKIFSTQVKLSNIAALIQREIVRNFESGDRERAIKLLNETGQEAQNRVLRNLKELEDLQRKSSQNILHDIEKQHAHSVQLILTWSIFAFVLGSILAYAVFLKITRTEKQLSSINTNLESLVKKRTQSIQQALEDLKNTQDLLIENEKMASLGSLVAGVAHEVNTPLGVGLTSSTLLKEKIMHLNGLFETNKITQSSLTDFLQQSEETCSILENNLHKAAELIASFKQLAVDQTSDQTFNFNVYDTLNSSLTSLNHILKKQKIQSILSCNEQLTTNSNAGSVSQVATNLIMNASIHAFDDNTANPTIEIKVIELPNNGLEIQFIDNGKGMSEEVLEKVFEPFFTTKRGQGGSGLGLHLVYNLVTQKLKGTITVQSELGKGTRFIVNIPSQIDPT